MHRRGVYAWLTQASTGKQTPLVRRPSHGPLSLPDAAKASIRHAASMPGRGERRITVPAGRTTTGGQVSWPVCSSPAMRAAPSPNPPRYAHATICCGPRPADVRAWRSTAWSLPEDPRLGGVWWMDVQAVGRETTDCGMQNDGTLSRTPKCEWKPGGPPPRSAWLNPQAEASAGALGCICVHIKVKGPWQALRRSPVAFWAGWANGGRRQQHASRGATTAALEAGGHQASHGCRHT